MRVGLLPGSAHWVGGPGTYLTGFAQGVARDEVDVSLRILLLGLGQLRRSAAHQRQVLRDSFPANMRVPVVARPVSPRWYRTRAAGMLPRLDRLFGRHDVYHQAHLDMDPPVSGDRLVLTLHDLIATAWPDEGSLLPRAGALLRRAAAVITVSETSRARILERFHDVHPERVHVIWNGVDHTSFTVDRSGTDIDRLRRAAVPSEYILYVGGITRRKNVPALVEAHGRLRDRGVDVPPLVLVGPWRSSQLTEVLHRDLGPSVIALGSVATELVPILMRHACVVAAPSCDEGFGLPLLEAQACGAIAVCSDIPVFREVGGAAPLYTEPTEEGLAAAIQLALEMSTEERDGRRKVGVDHARDFSWSRSAAAHAAVYRQVGSGSDAV